MSKETYYNTELFNWCTEIDWSGEGDFYERLKPTNIFTHHYHFNIYLRRRLPDKSLQHVRMWKDVLPDIEEIGCIFGGGTAIIDFEVLFGRNRGKKKCGIRAKINFDETMYNEKKRIYDQNRFAKEVEQAGGGTVGQSMVLLKELAKTMNPKKGRFQRKT
jgi:hypothetical protein